MNFLQQALAYIFTAANWSGKTGLGTRSWSTCSTPASPLRSRR